MAKRFATDTGFRVCDRAMQLHGGSLSLDCVARRVHVYHFSLFALDQVRLSTRLSGGAVLSRRSSASDTGGNQRSHANHYLAPAAQGLKGTN